jgi:hypothetical protein
MMRIVPVKNQEVESTNNLASTEEDVKPKFFSVDRNPRRPVQGWTSGKEYILGAAAAQELAEEARREFKLDEKSRWPLQGWCKAPIAPKNFGSQDDVIPAAKARAQSRWIQGW